MHFDLHFFRTQSARSLYGIPSSLRAIIDCTLREARLGAPRVQAATSAPSSHSGPSGVDRRSRSGAQPKDSALLERARPQGNRSSAFPALPVLRFCYSGHGEARGSPTDLLGAPVACPRRRLERLPKRGSSAEREPESKSGLRESKGCIAALPGAGKFYKGIEPERGLIHDDHS